MVSSVKSNSETRHVDQHPTSASVARTSSQAKAGWILRDSSGNLTGVTVECNPVGGSTDEAWLVERYAEAREYVKTMIGS